MSTQSNSKWTDERIALLKKLHATGMSFGHMTSQPGFRGLGFSRNALIGKANRIGLTQRSAEARHIAVRVNSGLALKCGRKPTLTAPPVKKAGPNPLGRKSGRVLSAPPVKADPYIGRSLTSKIAASAKRPAGLALPPEPPPTVSAVRLEELQANHCRWPIGDPQDAAFGFCGADKANHKKPYCAGHLAMAFARLPARAPRTGNELARSLRRYTA